MPHDYTILLYYCYTNIQDPATFREQHHLYCLKHQLRGRIIVAAEGINGTISGKTKDCIHYMTALKADTRFAHASFRIETHHQHVFKKLHVRLKKEIVHAALTQITTTHQKGAYIAPKDFKEAIHDPNVVLLDVRSNYEHRLGKFKNSITLDIEDFRTFKMKIQQLSGCKAQNKKIITICTGGIKCEKASAYLIENGFNKVYQLHGGIVQYGLDTDGKDFQGKCYVFDNRVMTTINKKNPTVISQCYVCQSPCERMVNCANPHCNQHVPICINCSEALQGACSQTCQCHPDKRWYDGSGSYHKKTNGYNPYKCAKRRITVV